MIDEAGAKKGILSASRPSFIKEMEVEISKLSQTKKKRLLKNQEFEKAAILRDEIKKEKKELENAINEWRVSKKEKKKYVLISQDIAKSSRKSYAYTCFSIGEKKKVIVLMRWKIGFSSRILNQEDAVEILCKSYKRSVVGLKTSKRPVGSFLFLGPTGVGKLNWPKGWRSMHLEIKVLCLNLICLNLWKSIQFLAL